MIPTVPRAASSRGQKNVMAVLASILALSASYRAFAQAAPATTSAGTPGDEDAVVLTEFTVTTAQDKGYRPGNSVSATRINTPIKDLPFAVSAYTEQFITDIGAHDLRDIVRYAPSATNNSREFNQGDSRFSIRGFDANPQRNGVPASYYIDVATVERVEVVKGPASLLYGQIEPGGVINYISKTPFNKTSLSVNQQFGSYNYYRTSADVNVPIIGNKLLFRINAANENDYEYVQYHKGTTHVIAPVVTWNIDNKTSLTVDYQSFQRRERAQAFMIPNVSVNLTNATLYPDPTTGKQRFLYQYFGPRLTNLVGDRFNASEPGDFRDTYFDTLNLEFQRKFGEHWDNRSVFSYEKDYNTTKQHGRGDAEAVIPNSLLADVSSDPAVYMKQIPSILDLSTMHPMLTRRVQYQQGKNWNRFFQSDLVGHYDFNGIKWKPLVGVQYNRRATWGFTNTLNQPSSTNWDLTNPATWTFSNVSISDIPATGNGSSAAPAVSHTDNRGIYTAHTVSLFEDRLLFLGGLRWSRGHADSTATVPAFTISKTTPQVGVSYKITRDLSAYASYSEAFQANNQLLRDHSSQGTIPAKPNEGRGYEAGIKTDLMEGRVSATLAAFSIEEKNTIIVSTDFLPNGNTVQTDFQDQNKVKNDGVELEIIYSPVDNFQVYLSGSYNNPRYASVAPSVAYLKGTQPESSAKELANLWTRYTFKGGVLDSFWVGGGFNYTGKKLLISNNPFLYWPNRIIWNAAVGYDWKWNKTNLSASLTWDDINNQDDTQSVRSRSVPRRLLGSLTVKF